MSLKGKFFHVHNQSSKLNASDYVEDEGKNDVNDEMMVRLKGKITTINYNRSNKIDKINENKKKTNDLQIFPPFDVNG